MNFTGAGCIFSNEQFILAGYQPRKQKPIVSGLGGKREGEEEASTTALRETLEELFELHEAISPEWIQQIQTTIPSKGVLQNGDYISFLYTFEDLQKLLELLHQYGCQSCLYDTFPTNLFSLLFNRKLLAYPPEVSHLLLFPLVHHPKEAPFVAKHFLSDIRLLLTKPSSSVDS